MKKILIMVPILVSALMVSGSCNGNQGTQPTAAKTTNGAKEVKAEYAINITRQQFLTRVMDYTKGAENMRYLGDKPAIVDFWASWCRPCRIAGPILEELAKEYEGKIYVYKVNTQTEQQIAAELGIQSIPTFIFFPVNGKPFATSGIAQTPEETKKMFKEIIDKQLLNKK